MEIAFTKSLSRISEADLAFQVAAIDLQMRRDFAPAWLCVPWPCVAYKTLPAQSGQFHPMFYMDNIGDPNALGFHDDLANFVYGRVLTPLDAADATTGSHEAGEMRVDPDCTQYGSKLLRSGLQVALETGDPVEADSYPVHVTIAGFTREVFVSNFVLPNYFDPSSPGPWDHMGLLRGPAPAMTPGGYLILRDPTTGEFSYTFADRGAARHLAALRADPTSRAAKRHARA